MTRRATYRAAAAASFPNLVLPVNFATRLVTSSDAWSPGSDYSLVVGPITGNITLTLPANPNLGDQYEVRTPNGLGIYTVTISGNGNQIESATTLGTFAASYVLSALTGALRFRYIPISSGTYRWVLV